MKPPICALCHTDFRHETDSKGGLLYFTLTPEQEAERRRMVETHMTGHPPGAAWFCSEHYEQASQLTHLSSGEAMKKLREIFSL